jgi:hypothetical protein
VPAETPVTTPVDGLTVAIAKPLLDHVPPVVASLRVVEEPAQIGDVPVMPAGFGFTKTVTVSVFTQPTALVPVTV